VFCYSHLAVCYSAELIQVTEQRHFQVWINAYKTGPRAWKGRIAIKIFWGSLNTSFHEQIHWKLHFEYVVVPSRKNMLAE